MIKARRSKAWIEAVIGRLRAGCREIALFGTPRCRARRWSPYRGRYPWTRPECCVAVRVRIRITTYTSHECVGARWEMERPRAKKRRDEERQREREREKARELQRWNREGWQRKREIGGTRPKSGAIAPSDVAISLNMRTTIWRPRRVRTQYPVLLDTRQYLVPACLYTLARCSIRSMCTRISIRRGEERPTRHTISGFTPTYPANCVAIYIEQIAMWTWEDETVRKTMK